MEVNGGKLAPRSIKCTLIGYFGCDAYHLFDRSMGRVYCSRDVVFKKGTGHQTISVPLVLNEGEIDHVILQPTSDVNPLLDLGPILAHATTGHPPPQPVLPAPELVSQNIQ